MLNGIEFGSPSSRGFMTSYPLAFESSALANHEISHSWESFVSSSSISCSIPKEFDGPGSAFSPEDFFLFSIQNCFIGTFKILGKYSKLEFKTVKVKSKLIVNKDMSGRPWMESVDLSIEVSGVKDEQKMHSIIKKTIETGFVLRSVKTSITYNLKMS
jgi:organic hydroperoxide reductase OsmC/OhrA